MKKIFFIIFNFLFVFAVRPAHDTGYVVGLKQDAADAERTITFTSKDGTKFKVPLKLLAQFELVQTALDADRDAREIRLGGISSAELQLLLDALIDRNKKQLKTVEQIKSYILEHINLANINSMYRTAEYMGVKPTDILFTILAQKYANLLQSYLHKSAKEQKAERINVLEQIKQLVNSKQYVPQIAKQYFLKFAQDIDAILGTKSQVTVQELVDAQLLSPEIVRLYPNLDKNPNERSKLLERPGVIEVPTALLYAMVYLSIENVLALIKLGANVKAENYFEKIAQLDAISDEKAKKIAEILVRHKAPIDIPDVDGYTPLTLAATNFKNKLAEFLLSQGASLKSKTKDDDDTPLAVVKRRLQFYLDREGITIIPIPLERRKKHAENVAKLREIIELFKKHGAK